MKQTFFLPKATLLLLVMLCSIGAWATVGDVVDSGTCGEGLSWTLIENGEPEFTYNSNTYTPLTLTITGSGYMTNYDNASDAPWYSHKTAITHLKLPDGLKRVGKMAFDLALYVQSVTLPASVSTIGEKAFSSVGRECSTGCTFTAAIGSVLSDIRTDAFKGFGGNVDLRNCTKLTTIGEKVFETYKSHTVYLPVSIRTIKKDAFYSISYDNNKPTVKVSYNNSVLYINGEYKAFSTEAKNMNITSYLNLKAKSSDAVSINEILLDEIKLSFDETDKSFVISNETDLLSLSNYVNSNSDHTCEEATFKMNADLDMRNRNFEPIGLSSCFAGHFDGQGHSISKICYSVDDNIAGLFGTLGGKVENVTLINPEFSGKYDVGGIAGALRKATIQNCIVVGGTISGDEMVGGIVGKKTSGTTATIRKCTVVGTTISGNDMLGCIAGGNSASESGLKIYDCIYDASINNNICGYGKYTENGNLPVYQLNLGYGITASDVLTFGNYTVATLLATITLDANRAGYEFVDFQSDDVTINNGQFDMPNENVTITAVWEPLNNISLNASLIDGLYWTTFYCGDAGYRIDEDENACAYTATFGDDVITLHLLGKMIKKETAVIIVGEDNSISMTRDDVSAAEYSVKNDLRGVDEPTARTTLTSDDAKTLYMLSNKNDRFGFHQYGGTNVPARKAYYTVSSSADARPFSMVFEEEPTEIVELKDGKIEKLKFDDSWYTLDGRKLDGKPTEKGVYIRGGRKVVIK